MTRDPKRRGPRGRSLTLLDNAPQASTTSRSKRRKKASSVLYFTGATHASLQEALAVWRRSLSALQRTVKARKPSQQQQNELWWITEELSSQFGVPWSDPVVRARVESWWDKHAQLHPTEVFTVLSAAMRTATTRLATAVKKGELPRGLAETWLASVLPLFQWAAMSPVLEQPVKLCKSPTGRKGCSADFDDVLSCIRRAGGIRTDDPVRAELVHAWGSPRLPGVLTRKGQSFSRIAELLTHRGYVPSLADDFGRTNEEGALDVVIQALRASGEGRRVYADPKRNQCAAKRQERSLQLQEQQLYERIAEEFAGLEPGSYEVVVQS